VKEAMLKVDRGNYVSGKHGAYDDCPQGIGYAATISAPHMHAHALEDMLPALLRAAHSNEVSDISILDIGCGSGYLSACLGRMVDRGPEHNILGKKGRVYGIDYVPELVDLSKQNMQNCDSDLFTSGTVFLSVGDGWQGLREGAPYHAIHVGAAADGLPMNLMTQLAVGGTLICPIGPDGGSQHLYKIDRVAQSPLFTKSDYEVKPLLGVRYVPLVKVPTVGRE
jgi:protein-L-isoaspartate(D-aspartate) O-methyltransferase